MATSVVLVGLPRLIGDLLAEEIRTAQGLCLIGAVDSPDDLPRFELEDVTVVLFERSDHEKNTALKLLMNNGAARVVGLADWRSRTSL